MPRIAEKLEFMTGCAVKVYAKVWIGRKAGHKKPCFLPIVSKTVSETKFLDSSRCFFDLKMETGIQNGDGT